MRPQKIHDRLARKRRIRARIRGTAKRPRLTVYRSLHQIIAQIVDDDAGRTLVGVSTKNTKAKPTIEGAKKLGVFLGEKAKEAKITSVVFDRNGYTYHGRVKALAEAARASGLQF